MILQAWRTWIACFSALLRPSACKLGYGCRTHCSGNGVGDAVVAIAADHTDSRSSRLKVLDPHSPALVVGEVGRTVHTVAVNAEEAVGGLRHKNYPISQWLATLEGHCLGNRMGHALVVVAEAG